MYSIFGLTGNVGNRPRSGRPRSATNEQNEVLVLGSVVMKAQHSLKEIAYEAGGSMSGEFYVVISSILTGQS